MEEVGIFPAHEVFKKLGNAGLLGINKPAEYGGMGLDYSYAMVMAEELGHIQCGSVPMAIGVQTDMATPALARYGSDASAQGVPRALHRRRLRRLPRRLRGRGRLRRGLYQDHGAQGRWRLGDQRRQDVDHQRHAGRLDVPPGQHRRRPGAQNKSLICLPMKTKGVEVVKQLDKLGMRSSDTARYSSTR